MRDITILTEADLRALVHLDLDSITVVEEAFRALATLPVSMPPILSMEIPESNGEVDVKTAYIPGLESFAIKVSPGFFDNPKLGLPSLNGLMILFSAKTGLVEALLLDNGYLTDVRTAAAGAVAAKYLAPPKVGTAAVFGTGLQARLQMQALHLVRPFTRALVWGRDKEKAERCAADLAELLGVEAQALEDAGRAAAESEVVVTTTPARRPIFKAEWLHPGLHVTAMGSDAAEKNEIEPLALTKADIFVCDRISQSLTNGELHHAVEQGVVAADFPAIELGRIVAGQSAWKASAESISLCDLTGTGVQDTAIATHAFALARVAGRGQIIKA